MVKFFAIAFLLSLIGCGRSQSGESGEADGIAEISYVFQLRNINRRPVESASVLLYLPVQKTPYQDFLDFRIKGGSVEAIQRSDEQGNNLVEIRFADLPDNFRLSLNLIARVGLGGEDGPIPEKRSNDNASHIKGDQETPPDQIPLLSTASQVLAAMNYQESPSPDTTPCVSDANKYVVAALDKSIEARVVAGIDIHADPLVATCWVEIYSPAGWVPYILQEQKLEPLKRRYIALRILDPRHEYSEGSIGELFHSSYGLDVSPVAYEFAAGKKAD